MRAQRQEYVLAARAVGVPSRLLVSRHILPDVLPPLIVQAMLFVGTAILEVAGLSFLGLAAQPPAPEWGAMISARARGGVRRAGHHVLPRSGDHADRGGLQPVGRRPARRARSPNRAVTDLFLRGKTRMSDLICPLIHPQRSTSGHNAAGFPHPMAWRPTANRTAWPVGRQSSSGLARHLRGCRSGSRYGRPLAGASLAGYVSGSRAGFGRMARAATEREASHCDDGLTPPVSPLIMRL